MIAAAMHDDRGSQGNRMGALWLWVSPCNRNISQVLLTVPEKRIADL
jgi:hypothetical protein